MTFLQRYKEEPISDSSSSIITVIGNGHVNYDNSTNISPPDFNHEFGSTQDNLLNGPANMAQTAYGNGKYMTSVNGTDGKLLGSTHSITLSDMSYFGQEIYLVTK
jgi:hypothetical protein